MSYFEDVLDNEVVYDNPYNEVVEENIRFIEEVRQDEEVAQYE